MPCTVLAVQQQGLGFGQVRVQSTHWSALRTAMGGGFRESVRIYVHPQTACKRQDHRSFYYAVSTAARL